MVPALGTADPSALCHPANTASISSRTQRLRITALTDSATMVAASTVVDTNARFAKEQHSKAVCVFAGATAGIGMATLKKTAALLHLSTFYILGRSPARYGSLLDQLQQIGPTNTYNFIEAQVSLISDIDTACAQIISAETQVDYIFMSPGGVPWQGAVCMIT